MRTGAVPPGTTKKSLTWPEPLEKTMALSDEPLFPKPVPPEHAVSNARPHAAEPEKARRRMENSREHEKARAERASEALVGTSRVLHPFKAVSWFCRPAPSYDAAGTAKAGKSSENGESPPSVSAGAIVKRKTFGRYRFGVAKIKKPVYSPLLGSRSPM